ncbi:MAG: hypothetical protein R2684_15955 [Pyrinomonadaceae bacterium]
MPTLTLTEVKSVCSIAYDGETGERYQFADGATWSILQHWGTWSTGFKGIIIVPEGRSGVYCMSFAGTDSLLDVGVDINQVFGGLPTQYSQALRWAQSAYGVAGSSFVLAGHSLGGGLAAYCSVHLGCPAYTVNPAPLVGAATLSSLRTNAQITNYIASCEFVSSSPGRNPGIDVVVPSAGGRLSFFTDHSLSAVAPSIALPTKL